MRPGGRRAEGNRLNLGFFLGLEFLLGKRGPVVVVVDALGEEGWHTGMAVRPGLLLPGRIPLPLHRAAVDAERAGERFHRGQQTLLQPGNQQGRASLLALGLVFQAFFSQFPVLVEQDRETQLGCVGRQAAQVDLADDPLGEPSGDGPKVFLEPADHHGVEDFLGPDGDAPAEALRVEDFEQCGEAIRVPVVRGGRKEEPVLEPACQVADGPSDLRIDGILRTARRGSVVGLVEDEQRPGPEVADPVA